MEDFKNTILILTSNLGSPYILEGIGGDGELTEQARGQVQNLLKSTFRPEFLNRLDEIVFYKPLTREQIGQIVDLLVSDLKKRLADKELELELTPAAKAVAAADGYDPVYGARPLKRYIQHTVETMLAKAIVSEDLLPGTKLVVDARDNELTLRIVPPETAA